MGLKVYPGKLLTINENLRGENMKKLIFVLCLVFLFSSQAFPENDCTGDIKELISQCCNNFFSKNKNYEDYSELIIHRTNEFFAINEGTTEFEGKKPLSIHPIYAYGINGVAYYEVWLSLDGKNVTGWLLLSVTDKDYPIVNFSHDGIPYSLQLLENAKKQGITPKKTDKIYRFGVSYFTLENATGNLLAEFGAMPKWVSTYVKIGGNGKGDSLNKDIEDIAEDSVKVKEGIHYIIINNYDSLKNLFPKRYFGEKRAQIAEEMRNQIFPDKGHGEAYIINRDYYLYYWIYGTQCLYTQIPPHTSSNWSNCWSGSNNNAWTSIFGWWDKNMGKSRLIPTTIYGETCPIDRNTASRRAVIDPVQMWIRAVCGTFCLGSSGFTYWSNMWKGYQYASYKGYGWSYWYQWCNSPGCNVNLANILVNCIANNHRPAHVGANSHVWVGWGFAQWNTNTDWSWVYCYPGWSNNHSSDVWIWWHDLNEVTRIYVY